MFSKNVLQNLEDVHSQQQAGKAHTWALLKSHTYPVTHETNQNKNPFNPESSNPTPPPIMIHTEHMVGNLDLGIYRCEGGHQEQGCPVWGSGCTGTRGMLVQLQQCEANLPAVCSLPCCYIWDMSSKMGFQGANHLNANWNLWNTFSTCTFHLYTKSKEPQPLVSYILQGLMPPFVSWFWVGQKRIHSKMAPNILNIKDRCNMPQTADRCTKHPHSLK